MADPSKELRKKMNAIRALKVMNEEDLTVKEVAKKLMMMPTDIVFLVQILRANGNNPKIAYDKVMNN
jgi:hypothetical protein